MSVSLSVIEGGRSEGQPKQEGFVQVFSSLVRCKELSPGAFRLYCLLLDYSWSGKNECNPAQDTLADEMGVSEGSIKRWLKELEDFDLIGVRSAGGRKSNRYKLNRVVKVGQSREITSDRVDRVNPINPDRSTRSPVIYESHDFKHKSINTHTEDDVCDALPEELDPWNKEVINDESPPLSAPSPDKRKEEFSELLRAARVAPKVLPGLVLAALNAGRDADYIRRVIASSLKKDNPPGWVAFMINSNAEPPQPGGGVSVPGARRDFFAGLGNFGEVSQETRRSKWATILDHDESEAEE
jgi:hypothetical protein